MNWRDLKNKPGAMILGTTTEDEEFNKALNFAVWIMLTISSMRNSGVNKLI